MSAPGLLRRRWTWVAILAVVAVISGGVSLALAPAPTTPVAMPAASSSGPAASATSAPVPSPTSSAPAPTEQRPNVIFVLTDDLETSLLRFMPQARRMQRDGADFTRYSVSNSYCCPSRSTIMTGQYPHNTTIFGNTAPDGGYAKFRARGLEKQTYALALQRSGYRTGFMGKYLNGYQPGRGAVAEKRVPVGWDTWVSSGDAYPEFDYRLNVDGKIISHGRRARDYLTDVLAGRAERFVRQGTSDERPFFLEVSTYAPHEPYVPAPRDDDAYPGLKAPRGPAFDEADVTDKPRWIRRLPRLSPTQIAAADRIYRLRAQSVRSIDRMLGQLRRTLADTGQLDNTYVVFSSDNGYHLGQHRLPYGKRTAYTTDVIVPLVVTGPGVRAGSVGALAQNVDLAPTFAELAGTRLPHADGRSLVPLLRGQTPDDWRRAALVEHHGAPTDPSDPDYQPPSSGNPPSYGAVITKNLTYVRYADGERELYDRRKDPRQLANAAPTLSRAERRDLDRMLRRLTTCRGTDACQVR